jgi:hypothetical protein
MMPWRRYSHGETPGAQVITRRGVLARTPGCGVSREGYRSSVPPRWRRRLDVPDESVIVGETGGSLTTGYGAWSWGGVPTDPPLWSPSTRSFASWC